MSKQTRQSRRQRNALLKQRSRRLLQAEHLEDRMMLAADLHNDIFPLDTNLDQQLTPNDVLAVINHLNSSAGAEAEGGSHRMVDTNGDGIVSSNDALRVINALNGEGETGPVLRVITRIFEQPANYPFDAGGNRVAATNEITSVGVGQNFVVKLFVEDIRSMGTREGVFSTYVDVNFDNPAIASLVPSLTGVLHPQTNQPTPYIHNNFDPEFVFGERAEPSSGTGLRDTDGNGSLDQIDFIGSFSGRLRGPGAGEFELVEWAMTANTVGSLTINAEPTTNSATIDPNDADESPLFDAGIFGQDEPVCPSQSTTEPCMGDMEFISDTITVVDRILAVPDTFNIVETAPAQTFDLLGGSTPDINNTQGTLTISSVTQGNLGSVVNNGNNVTYTPGGNSGTDTFNYTIANGLGDFSSALVTVNISPVNDPPINSVPGPQSVDEDPLAPLTIPPISVSDGDGDVTMTVNLAANLGTISVPTTNGVTITNPDSSSVSLDGLVSNVNNALSSITYSPNLNANGLDTLTVTSNDGITADVDTVNITINPINDAPVNTVPGPATLFNTETLPFNAGAFRVEDVDASTLNVTLTVDQGTLQFGAGGTPANLLTASGSISSINSQLNSLIYDPIDTFVGTDTLTMTTNDNGQTGGGGALTDTDTVSLMVAPPIVPFAASDLFDVEEDPAAALTFTLADLFKNDLAPVPMGSDPANTLSLTLINGSSPASGPFSTQFGSLTYDPTSTAFTYSPSLNSNGTDTFTYTIVSSPDAGNGPSQGTVNIDVQAINDGPINSFNGSPFSGSPPLSLDEGGTLTFNGANSNLLGVADIDAGAAGVTVTLSVGQGTLTVSNGGGTVANNGTGTVSLDGTSSEINTRLNGLTYTPETNYAGSDQLQINTNDNGNTGGATGNPTASNPLSDIDTINITIQPINDAPVIVVPGNQTFITDFDNILSSANGNAFSIDDVDAGNDDVQVDLTIADGTLTLSDASNLSSVSGNGTNSLTVLGSVTNINTSLGAGITYRTSNDGNQTLSATVNDLGNNGGIPGNPNAVNPLSASDNVAIEVLDFVPSNIGGFVFFDINNDSNKGSADMGLEGVVITLTGTTFRNTAVDMKAITAPNGSYLFPNLEPGNYMLGEAQPANLNSGTNSFHSPIVASGNDQANITIPIAGNIDSRNNNFAERGLTTPFISMFDLLDSQFQRSGALLSTNGSATWSSFLGVGWENYSNPRINLTTLTLTVTHSSGGDRHVNLRANDPAVHGGTYLDRVMVRQQGQDQVIRLNGSAAEFGLTAAQPQGEGEGDQLAAIAAASSEMFAQAADQVFGEMA